MAHVEPMDLDCIDGDFDNKENTYQHNNAAPRMASTEKGYEELDVSDLNMKLRYSVTPAASPMSKSYTANCNDNKTITSVEDVLNSNNANLTRSFNSTFTNSDSILKSPKSLPLQCLSSDNYSDLNRNSTIRRSLDVAKNNVTVTITTLQDNDDNLSLPSTSSSLPHTPEATTPTKEIQKQDGGSPIMRGLKSVLSMFRTSQSPIPPVDGDIVQKKDVNVTENKNQETNKQPVLASTPIRNNNSPPKGGSPLKESVVFKDDLERELHWKDDSTIIFKEEKIPIHKLFLPSLPVEIKPTNLPDNMNNTVEYMDISLNESALNDQVKQITNSEAACAESDSEFQDCETTFTKTEQDVTQLTSTNTNNNLEMSHENINMSIVENEYHDVKDQQIVALNSSECIKATVTHPMENVANEKKLAKQIEEAQKDCDIKDMHETNNSEEKVSDFILPDVVENTLNKSLNETDSKQQELHHEPINTTINAESYVGINQTLEAVDDKDLSVCNNSIIQGESIAKSAINVTTIKEVHLVNENRDSNTLEIENPRNELAKENPLPLKTFAIEEEAVNLDCNTVSHESNDKDISVKIGNEEGIKTDIFNGDLSVHDEIENTSTINTQLEETQSNMKLVYDEMNDTLSVPLNITNEIFLKENICEENRNNLTVTNNVQLEPHNDELNTNKDLNTSGNNKITSIATVSNEVECENNIISDVCQDKINNAYEISFKYIEPLSLSGSEFDEKSNNIKNDIESHTDVSVPPMDVPLPLENDDDKTIDCINIVKASEDIISELIMPTPTELMDDDVDSHNISNKESQNATILVSTDLVNQLDTHILTSDDEKKLHSTLTDLHQNMEANNSFNETKNKEVLDLDQVTAPEVKELNETENIISNYQNDKTLFENKNQIEQGNIENIEEIAEQNRCDMEVENVLTPNIDELPENKNINNKSDCKNYIQNNESMDTTVKHEIVAGDNNAVESVSSMEIDGSINPFDTKTRILATPPSSPKIVSKGYNFNFDEIDDPFATKTKIRESPTPTSLPNNTFKPIGDQGKRKSINTNRKPIPNRRKSQPVPKTEPIAKNGLNSTFDSSTFTRKSFDKLKTEENKINEGDNEQGHEKKYNQLPLETEDINCSNKDIICTMKETIQNKIEEHDKFESDSASTVSDIPIQVNRKNVFNIPEIDDKNFNPFASRSKVCSSPILDNNCSTIQDNTNSMSVCDTTVNINNIDSESNVVNDVTKENPSDISNITVSSKHTDDKNNTVKELNTEDEDTVEGPFLEPEDFVNFDKDTDILPSIDKDDMIGFDDFPVQPNNDDNSDNAEIFIDAEAFEFLLNQNKSNVVADSGKESLFLKFDPLFAKRVSSDGIMAALNKPTKKVSTPKKTQVTRPDVPLDPFIAGPSSSKPVVSYYPEDVNVTKPTMIVNPAVNSIPSPRKAATPPKINRQSLTFTSPAMAVIDRLLSLSGNSSFINHDTTVPHVSSEQHQTDLALSQLREMLAEKEIHVQTLRSEREELKDRLAIMESQVKSLESESENRLRNITELNQRLTEKTKENKTMGIVVEEYERTIASLVAELEQDKRRNAEERTKLIRDRDEQTAHLASMEVSFSDLHSKYEKSKQIIFSLKANEDTYKKSIKEFEENLVKMQNNYELLKQHATSKLNHANSELEKMNRAHEAEVLKLNAMIKRKDLHITSLEETLAQKTKANEELTAICDELINKVG